VFERSHPEWDGCTVAEHVDLVTGAFYARVVSGLPFPDDWAVRTMRTIVDGIPTGNPPVGTAP
jgi:hypothetical protein